MKHFRKILFPFAWIYGAIVAIRNKMFDWGILSSKAYDFPLICIGNLSVGGTGKSPMVEYLIGLLKKENCIATLSRGYKRSTKGFHLLNGKESAKEVGDEPLQFKTKFPEILVAVDENRQRGISELRDLENPPEIIVLDDAFQHRKVRAGLNILLTTYQNLYCNDFLLPVGSLRESRSGANRANIVVVTKCPKNISSEERKKIKNRLKLKNHQTLYFSKIVYDEVVSNGFSSIKLSDLKNFTLVTGIARPEPLLEFLDNGSLTYRHIEFRDHHHFTENELETLRKEELLVTTEKDYMRLKGKLPEEKLFFISIKTYLIEKSLEFEKEIKKFVQLY